MSGITVFVLLTGIAAGVVWWLGYRMARTGHAIHAPHATHDAGTEREHHKAA